MQVRKLTRLLLAVLTTGLAVTPATAIGQKNFISFTSGNFQLAPNNDFSGPGQIRVSPNDYWGVIRAAGDLAVDFGRVTGLNLTLTNGLAGAKPATYDYQPVDNMNNTVYHTTGNESFTGPDYTDPAPGQTVILAGTVGHSKIIDSLVEAGKLNVTAITGQWEAFVTALVSEPLPGCAQALVVAGSDPRGTIFGLYDISEQIGVSPWHFWADVAVRPHEMVYAVLLTPKVQLSPSVKYRGFFINDEQPDLTDWVAQHWPDTPYGAGYGPGLYKLMFELLLRLRANYLWPAIWSTMFEVDDPANQPLADAYEIVMGSSHTEPLMRAQNEYSTFYAGQGAWAYDQNNKTIDEYFRYGVRRAKPYARNSLWTMGMRGTGDTAIESDGVDSIVSMLNTLVTNQQQIITEGLGDDTNISDVAQMWCLYKEVQSYLSEGLEVPDDVTLLWSDDNWGNVRRLPLADERDRAGGAGIYYHFDYVGDPRDYKWINTVQLTKTAEQMGLAYARGADRIWIVNVGDLKALELPLSHFLDMAYDMTSWGIHEEDDTVSGWTAAWARREFGLGTDGEDDDGQDKKTTAAIVDVVARYSMYASRRKFELVEPQTYSVLNYGEAETVLEQWQTLVADAQHIYDALLDPVAQPAFFEMILHPVLAGEIIHRLQMTAARNQLYAGQKRNQANTLVQKVLEASDDDVKLTWRWDGLLNGKWKHMMSQTHLGFDGYWQQPMRNSLPDVRYVQTAYTSLAGDVGIGIEGSNATIPGDDKWHTNSANSLVTLPLDSYGTSRRYFDVFSRGIRTCTWTAAAAPSWLVISPSSGIVGPDQPGNGDVRVYVSVNDWTQAVNGTVQINITTPCRQDGLDRYGYSSPTLQVPVIVHEVPSNFSVGFVEADQTIAIDAAHYQTIVPPPTTTGSQNITYRTFHNYGRTGSGVGLWPPGLEKLDVDTAPALEYQLYLFSNTTTANVTLYLSPSQNYLGDDNPLEYGIALYLAGSQAPEPTMVQPVGQSVGQSMPSSWGFAVADSVWGVTSSNTTTTTFEVLQEGAYTLRI